MYVRFGRLYFVLYVDVIFFPEDWSKTTHKKSEMKSMKHVVEASLEFFFLEGIVRNFFLIKKILFGTFFWVCFDHLIFSSELTPADLSGKNIYYFFCFGRECKGKYVKVISNPRFYFTDTRKQL